jgi:hypothetical protein
MVFGRAPTRAGPGEIVNEPEILRFPAARLYLNESTGCRIVGPRGDAARIPLLGAGHGIVGFSVTENPTIP